LVPDKTLPWAGTLPWAPLPRPSHPPVT
jgi:hypothetical protein